MKKTIGFFMTSAVVAGMLTFAACSSDKDKALPQIDGYNNSDEVAKTNLVAHWTFDADNKEAISGTAPSNSYGTVGDAGKTTGQIGKALHLAGGALVYPPIAGINTANGLNSFSVSLWVNVRGTKGGTNAFTSFFGIVYTDESDIWPNIGLMAETSRHLPASDTIEFKNFLTTVNDDESLNLQDNVAQVNGDGVGKWFTGGKTWAHYVATWDPTTHNFHLYANGVECGAYTNRGTTGIEIMRVPAQAVFGSLVAKDIGFASSGDRQSWFPMANADIDDVRVFNATLQEKDITALYNLGVAGR